MQRTTELLQQLGLTLNEARAYTALLACQPATAYEIAKQSAIPTSKIYETVNRLVTRGVLLPTPVGEEHGQQYIALPAADFVSQARESALSQARELEPLLDAINGHKASDFIWPVTDDTQIRSRAGEMIAMATHSILVSAWPEELSWLADALVDAGGRGVKVALVHFGEPDITIGATYHHPAEKTLYEEKGGRGLTLVTDSGTVLIANYAKDGSIEGAWSHNRSFVTVAEDYVKHDVYITKVTRFLNDAVTARFGHDYEKLRDVFDADA